MVYVLLILMLLKLDISTQHEIEEDFNTTIDKLIQLTDKSDASKKTESDVVKRQNSRIIYLTPPTEENNNQRKANTEFKLDENEESFLDNLYKTDSNNSSITQDSELTINSKTTESFSVGSSDNLNKEIVQEVESKTVDQFEDNPPYKFDSVAENEHHHKYPEIIVDKVTKINKNNEELRKEYSEHKYETDKSDIIIDELLRKILKLKIQAQKTKHLESILSRSMATDRRPLERRSLSNEEEFDEENSIRPLCDNPCRMINTNKDMVTSPNIFNRRSMNPPMTAHHGAGLLIRRPQHTDNPLLRYSIAQKMTQDRQVNNWLKRAIMGIPSAYNVYH